MGFLSDLLTGGADTLVSNITRVADQFITTDDERNEFKLKMAKLVHRRETQIEQTLRSEQRAKQEILTAELNQDDKFTKRARPMLVYFGLLMIAINYMLFPILARIMEMNVSPLPDLPWEFWAGWSGIVATWSIGRSAEKIGASNKVTRMITGQKNSGVVG